MLELLQKVILKFMSIMALPLLHMKNANILWQPYKVHG